MHSLTDLFRTFRDAATSAAQSTSTLRHRVAGCVSLVACLALGAISTQAAAQVNQNFALNKSTSQSSTYGTASAESFRAVDGVTGGYFPWFPVSLTNFEYQPWWQVDLGAVLPVDVVQVWSRRGCCEDRLGNFVVLVSNTDMTGRTLVDMLMDTTVTKQYVGALNGVAVQNVLFPGKTGRFVRLMMVGTGAIELTEVRVLKPAPYTVDTNLALGSAVTWSSNYGTAWPHLVVDGNTDGNFGNGSVGHTGLDVQPWIQIDLGTPRTVNTVELWNRTDGAGARMSNFYVLTSATDMTGKTLAQLVADPTVTKTLVPSLGVSLALPFKGKTARYVRVQLQATDYLNLAEVRVLGR